MIFTCVLVLCVSSATGWALLWLGAHVRDALTILLFPYWMTFRLLAWCWNTSTWARGKLKAWKREPAFGSADWATDAELRAGGNLTPGGFPIGRRNGKLIYTNPESHLLMFGVTGGMKSLTQAATFHHASGETLVSFDPKGLHRLRFDAELQAKGYKTFHIDLDNPMAGVGFDPMAFFEGSDHFSRDGDIDILARLITGDVGGHAREVERHFSDMAAAIIAGLTSHFMANQPAEASLYKVAHMMTLMPVSMRNKEFEKMMESSTDNLSRMAINAFEQAGKENEKGAIVTTTARHLKPWISLRYQELCKPDAGWSWDDVISSETPICIWVTGGLGRGEEFAAFNRVFFGQGVASIMRHYNRTQQPMRRRVKFLIDEADTMGGCKPIVDLITTLRSAGASVFMLYQSGNQLKQNYKGHAKTMLANCDKIVTGALADESEYSDMSKLIGRRTIYTQSKGRGSTSESETARRVVEESELYRLGQLEHVAMLRNLPVRMDKPFRIVRGEIVY